MISIEALYQIFQQHPIICTDTRKLTPGCIFFALKGDNFNGNLFAAQALQDGAAYAVIDDPTHQSEERFLLCADVLETLQQLAHYHRRKFDIPIIAIGGSNGKTTTKELISAVLSGHYPCHYTKGNFNNHIGVPLTLLSMPPETEVAVIEMGANQHGDIDLLCKIAAPTHGLLTNIGKEHLEGFGSLEGVKQAEGELFRYLTRTRGCAFVNKSEKYLSTMARSVKKKVFYGKSEKLQAQDGIIDVEQVAEIPFVKVAFLSENDERIEAESQLIGRHNFNNIMTAIALGTYFKVPGSVIRQAIESYAPSNNRSQLVHQGSNTFILDAYNANPSSMRPALEALRDLPAHKKVAILGDMLELGPDSLKEHEAILRFAARCNPDQIVLVGPEFGRCNYRKYKALHFANTTEARAWMDTQYYEKTLFLVKGSRGIRLEGMVNL